MKNKGFSLVELIVVIAIMAILVGVAVPVYTSYIDKANKSKDEQLVDEIKHAIQIAAVGDEWYKLDTTEGLAGYIILKPNGDAVVDGTLAPQIDKAMQATFGAQYKKELRLSYDEWAGTLNGSNLSNFMGSTFKDNSELLMDDVQSLTNSLEEFMANKPELLFGNAGADYIAFLKQNGIIPEDADAASLPAYSQKAANGATLLVANRTRGITEDEFVTAWTTKNLGGLMLDTNLEGSIGFMSCIAAEYARAEALVNRIGCPTLREIFKSDTEKLGLSNLGIGDSAVAVSTKEEVAANIGQMIVNAQMHLATEDCCKDSSIAATYLSTDGAKMDARAYYAMLGQVTESSDEVIKNIGNENVYAEGTIPEMVNKYISNAAVLSAALDGVSVANGEVAIAISVDENGQLTIVAYPIDPLK